MLGGLTRSVAGSKFEPRRSFQNPPSLRYGHFISIVIFYLSWLWHYGKNITSEQYFCNGVDIPLFVRGTPGFVVLNVIHGRVV